MTCRVIIGCKEGEVLASLFIGMDIIGVPCVNLKMPIWHCNQETSSLFP